jgi:hypothetical protein
MSEPIKDPPPAPSRASPVRKAPKGTSYTPRAGETWVSIAHTLGIDPWVLIDFNFPGMLLLKQHDLQAATRQVNWYLATYVGCWESKDGGKNYAFGNSYKAGLGDYAKGTIFLPPTTATATPPPPAGCTAIDIPAVDLPRAVLTIFELARIKVPTHARCLAPDELTAARNVYGESLNYTNIYVSDGIGASNRPVTVALPMDGRWIVILNMGPSAYNVPNFAPATLIHELAHAWQSQHHPMDPTRFMVHCALCQAAAAAASAAARVNSSRVSRIAGVPDLNLGPADAYSYIPGRPFWEYGGEQLAQQVEDNFLSTADRPLTRDEKNQIGKIQEDMKRIPADIVSPDNVRALTRLDRYVHKNMPGVVWHRP